MALFNFRSYQLFLKRIVELHESVTYNGYIMTKGYDHNCSMECGDKNLESVPGVNSASVPMVLFYPVEAKCDGLSFPLYNAAKELTFAVYTWRDSIGPKLNLCVI